MPDLQSIRHLLALERTRDEGYQHYLTLLYPPLLQKKLQNSKEEGGRHIQALEEALLKLGDPPAKSTDPLPLPGPSDGSTHSLLQYLYELEEKLYYGYLNAVRSEEEGWLRSLLALNLEDQKRHLATIQNIYAESLYY